MEQIKEYYDKLAEEYDFDRFGNTYGKYLDRQEKAILRKLFKEKSPGKTLDVGCGTGRFLEFAAYGIDLSPKMIKVAQQKFPEKKLFVESAAQSHFENAYFDTVISFHLFMHLEKKTTSDALDEIHRILKKGGRLIVDVPSKARRRLVKYTPQSWHGANDFTSKELKERAGDKWELKKTHGIAFFPIHWIPKMLRNSFVKFDSFIGRTFLKEYSSYILFVLEKK